MDQLAIGLRRRAEELGISHAAAARRSGLSERRYAHYVRGIREPDLNTLIRIAKALQTTPNVLLGFETSRPEPSKRSVLIDRLSSAMRGLRDKDLEMVLIQIEALANHRRPPKTRSHTAP